MMIFSSKNDEDLVVKWAVAEIVRRLRQKYPYALHYFSLTSDGSSRSIFPPETVSTVGYIP
jgi:hypothetical protein